MYKRQDVHMYNNERMRFVDGTKKIGTETGPFRSRCTRVAWHVTPDRPQLKKRKRITIIQHSYKKKRCCPPFTKPQVDHSSYEHPAVLVLFIVPSDSSTTLLLSVLAYRYCDDTNASFRDANPSRIAGVPGVRLHQYRAVFC